MAYKEKADAIKYNNAYISRSYDRINLLVPKGQKEIMKRYAESRGETVNSMINRLIDAELATISDNNWMWTFRIKS